MVSPSAAEHRPWTIPLHRALPPPRASDGRTSQLVKLRVPVLDWQLHFPGVLRVPESSTCTDGLSIPVETGRPHTSYDEDNLIDAHDTAQVKRKPVDKPCVILSINYMASGCSRTIVEPPQWLRGDQTRLTWRWAETFDYWDEGRSIRASRCRRRSENNTDIIIHSRLLIVLLGPEEMGVEGWKKSRPTVC